MHESHGRDDPGLPATNKFENSFRNIISASLCSSTEDAYLHHVNCFLNFLTKFYSIHDLKNVTAIHLGSFIAFLRESKSANTIRNYFSGLAYLFKLQNKPDITKHFTVVKALSGIQKLARENPSRLPISKSELLTIVDSV